MIYLYSGTPGSGKSLHTARVIYHTLKRGFPVVANFEIAIHKIKGKNLGEFVYVNNMNLTPEILINYALNYFNGERVREGEITLIIDECQILFNAREWNVKGRSDWLSFFTQHRKYGYDIILIAQFDRMIDRQIRSLIEYEQIHRKISNFGVWGKIFALGAKGNLFLAIKTWYPMKEKISREFFTANEKYYSLYDTFGMFQLGGSKGAGVSLAATDLEQKNDNEEEFTFEIVEV